MPIPLYGVVKGDTMVLVVLAHETETVRDLADKMLQAAGVRVARKGRADVIYKNDVLDPSLTIAEAGFAPLERFDVVQGER